MTLLSIWQLLRLVFFLLFSVSQKQFFEVKNSSYRYKFQEVMPKDTDPYERQLVIKTIYIQPWSVWRLSYTFLPFFEKGLILSIFHWNVFFLFNLVNQRKKWTIYKGYNVKESVGVEFSNIFLFFWKETSLN